jgi:hypothetical protein
MQDETIQEIRESFRHWQSTKIGDAFVFVTLSGKPEDVQAEGHIWLRDIKCSFPEASRWHKGDDQKE